VLVSYAIETKHQKLKQRSGRADDSFNERANGPGTDLVSEVVETGRAGSRGCVVVSSAGMGGRTTCDGEGGTP
jgi:hypothetical protein